TRGPAAAFRGLAAHQARAAAASEAVADGELEDEGVFTGPRCERDAPLEAEGADGRVPAEAEAHRGSKLERVEGLLDAPGVARVEEDHTADAHLREDGHLELGVEDEL